MPCVGGKLQAAEEEEEETTQPGRKPKAKVSRKERLQKKRDQKRAEREVGSDNDDVDNSELSSSTLPVSCVQSTKWLLKARPQNCAP